ncbi:uncharacterized protein PHALS_07373 [Plasmopara halstedii]|uniref:Uncharacterized protein n=1 Tax=Plasmopara halstedii TaxID=4781 RepID=A0A0N7L8E1_PLAHL|nr:uncharacterized protein PHALS_07373 [Plasmopara halstedii]CEG49619.1 hypothetical protein PHALS_07373 [Plasmopara halstedii]|eukprot:XP_024585988.1 hypothetical protein PHALS_07373 [Plasmopara halstedii]
MESPLQRSGSTPMPTILLSVKSKVQMTDTDVLSGLKMAHKGAIVHRNLWRLDLLSQT